MKDEFKIKVTYDVLESTFSIEFPPHETDDLFAISNMQSGLRDLKYAIEHKLGTYHSLFDINTGMTTKYMIDLKQIWKHQHENGHIPQDKVIHLVPKSDKPKMPHEGQPLTGNDDDWMKD